MTIFSKNLEGACPLWHPLATPMDALGAVHKWRHTILGKNVPPPPLVTFRHKYLNPLQI